MDRDYDPVEQNTISIETLPDYEQYVIVWFADIASQYLLGVDIHRLATKIRINKAQVLNDLYIEAQRYLDSLESQKNIKPCNEKPPIPLTQNDNALLFNLCTAVNALSEAAKGHTEEHYLPPALSFEFAEYVRTYMPKLTGQTLKRKAIYVSSEALAMAVLGAHISKVATVEDEHIYAFLSTLNPKLIDVKKLNNMAKSLVRAVINGDGGYITLLVGVASIIVLNLGRLVNEIEGRSSYSCVRITRTGKKTMLKSFSTTDLTDLAKTIMRLRIASAIYNLVKNYPSREEARKRKPARTLRSIIENLSNSIMRYHNYRDPTELYRAIRAATTKTTTTELESYLKETWTKAIDEILEIRI